jgi:uncharacterized Ntn-hydrolase superfamily protein
MNPPPVSTFSIVARDAQNGDLGVAVASKFLAVGAVVPWVMGGVGAVATQSYANTSFGPRALEAMRAGVSLPVIAALFASQDDLYQSRQYGMVDNGGAAFSFTGSECHPWAGGRTGNGYAVQGNLLAGAGVVDALADTFEARGDLAFPERLLEALLAGDRAGGDARGRQGAALYVARVDGGYAGFNDRLVDLRVDDHSDPVPELARLLRIHRLLFERPNLDTLLEISGDLARRLNAILVRAGKLEVMQPDWSAASQAALEDLAGTENLEERMVKSGFVDPMVLEYLERTYPAELAR